MSYKDQASLLIQYSIGINPETGRLALFYNETT
jgi:hypothetical protein